MRNSDKIKIRGITVGTPISPEKIVELVKDEVGESKGAVLHTPQTLTEGEKAQARANIGAITEMETEETVAIKLEQGSIDSTSGKDPETVNTSRIKSLYLETTDLIKVATKQNSDVLIYGHYYGADMSYIGNSGGFVESISSESIDKKGDNIRYFRIVAKREDNSALSPEAVAGVIEATYKKTVIGAESIWYTPQSLTPEQQAQARENIGVAYATVETPEEYFAITLDGVVSLKPEYRGALPESAPEDAKPYGKSDLGLGNAGSKNNELPKNIVIPNIVNETAVTELATAMFCYNTAVESIAIPSHITKIPDLFAMGANKLEAIKGTENVRELGKSTFQSTPLKTVSFPKLEETSTTGNQFRLCSNLISADLGKVTSIPRRMFAVCQRLSCVHGAENVTSVDEEAFIRTSRLRKVNFLPKLTQIGDHAFRGSRINYDWEALQSADCEFGTLATRLQYNPKDKDGLGWWEKAKLPSEPCVTPLRSILDQADPLWADSKIGTTNVMYREGCAIFCAMMIHSALSGKDINHPDEFVAEIGEISNPTETEGYLGAVNGKSYVGHSATGLANLFRDLGYDAELLCICPCEDNDKQKHENLQTVYDALEDGALVWAQIDGADATTTATHAVVLYGINEDGEVLAQDPNDGRCSKFGGTSDMHFATPIQNIIVGDEKYTIGLIIVKKKA